MSAVLTLSRTNRTTAAVIAVAAGYIADATSIQCFNGGGAVDATAAAISLAVDGGGFSLGGRFWMGAGDANPGARSADPVQLFGLPGIDASGVTAGVRVQVSHIDEISANWRLQLVTTGSTIDLSVGGVPTVPFTAIATFARKFGGVEARVYINGHLAASTQLTLADVAVPGLVRFGDLYKSDGGFSHLALWTRVLAPDEVGGDITHLNLLSPAGGGTNGIQYLRPSSYIGQTNTAGGSLGGPGNLTHTYHLYLDDVSAINADGDGALDYVGFIGHNTLTLGLSAPTSPPHSLENHTVRMRMVQSVGTLGSATLECAIWSAGVLVATTGPVDSTQAINGETFSHTLSEDEVRRISDYSTLHMILTSSAANDRGFAAYWAWLEVPTDNCDPLLKADGTTAINPDFPVPRQDGPGVTIVDEGPHRWTRNPHETRPRTYSLPFNLGDPNDVEVLRQALEVTKGGATWTRWRHPIDDAPGPVATAPRYRIVNAGDAGIAIERTEAGQAAKFTLILEALDL